jgi:hypothetical protein
MKIPTAALKSIAAAVAPAVAKEHPDEFQVGVILYSPWGSDQTNVDWYLITNRTKARVTLKPLIAKLSYRTDMTGLTQPLMKPHPLWGEVPVEANAPHKVKIIRRHKPRPHEIYDTDAIFPAWMNAKHGVFRVWDGEPKTFSTYA